MSSFIVHKSQVRNFVKYPERIANSERDFAGSTVNLFLATQGAYYSDNDSGGNKLKQHRLNKQDNNSVPA